MITSLPPGRSIFRLCSSAISSARISPFTSMRSAWKSFDRNLVSSFFGVQGATAAVRSLTVAIGRTLRARSMQFAILYGVWSSPQRPRRVASLSVS